MLLAIETSTDVCSVALANAGGLVAEASLLMPRRHATRLAPLVAELLAHADLAPGDLEAVAVSAGPGSFTGLRIGVSTAKGLCLATGARLVAVPSLEAQALAALGHAGPGDLVAAAFRSRRGEVFAAVYAAEDQGSDTGLGLGSVREPAALADEDLGAWLPPRVRWLTGEASASLAPHALEARVLPDPPAARHVARLGLSRLSAGLVEDAGPFEPAYLKAFVPSRPGAIFPARQP